MLPRVMGVIMTPRLTSPVGVGWGALGCVGVPLGLPQWDFQKFSPPNEIRCHPNLVGVHPNEIFESLPIGVHPNENFAPVGAVRRGVVLFV